MKQLITRNQLWLQYSSDEVYDWMQSAKLPHLYVEFFLIINGLNRVAI